MYLVNMWLILSTKLFSYFVCMKSVGKTKFSVLFHFLFDLRLAFKYLQSVINIGLFFHIYIQVLNAFICNDFLRNFASIPN
jgi:hypothetical protein